MVANFNGNVGQECPKETKCQMPVSPSLDALHGQSRCMPHASQAANFTDRMQGTAQWVNIQNLLKDSGHTDSLSS